MAALNTLGLSTTLDVYDEFFATQRGVTAVEVLEQLSEELDRKLAEAKQ